MADQNWKIPSDLWYLASIPYLCDPKSVFGRFSWL